MWRILAAVAVVAVAGAFSLDVVLGTEHPAPARLPESAMPGRLLVGFQDDPSLRWANDRTAMLDRAARAGATLVRTTVIWADAAPRRPRDPADPFDPAYRLDDVDELARNAQARGMELLLTIWGTPRWANGGRKPNRPPTNARELADFAEALADRYSGRHAGYPAVRLFSAWNEPNIEQFLAPQFDGAGESRSPALYAEIARAVYDGVKRGNSEALVAVGETSARGRDRPSSRESQDTHSPARFARLLAAERPRVDFDAWAVHPYPTRPYNAAADPVRWPGVGLTSLERFGRALERWFEREKVPLWITEYGHETRPAERLGVTTEQQARYARQALGAATGNPRVRMLVWFVLRDSVRNPWQSGLLTATGRAKPALWVFGGAARAVDARRPVVDEEAGAVLVPALELAYYDPEGAPITVTFPGGREVRVALRRDGWLEVPLEGRPGERLVLRARDGGGRAVERVVDVQS